MAHDVGPCGRVFHPLHVQDGCVQEESKQPGMAFRLKFQLFPWHVVMQLLAHNQEHAMYALHLFKMARPGEGPFKLVLKFT